MTHGLGTGVNVNLQPRDVRGRQLGLLHEAAIKADETAEGNQREEQMRMTEPGALSTFLGLKEERES